MVKADIFIIMDVFIKDKLKIIKQTDSVYIMILFKVTNITDSGKTMFHMERENKNSKMALIMKGNFSME